MCGQLTLGIKKFFLTSGLVGVGIYICCDCSCEEQMVMELQQCAREDMQ